MHGHTWSQAARKAELGTLHGWAHTSPLPISHAHMSLPDTCWAPTQCCSQKITLQQRGHLGRGKQDLRDAHLQ